jgi:enamine deaminase RidA (YjgF/YER057c/UK114 family)
LAKQRISTPEAPEYDPVYAQAIRAGNTVYLGGTVGVDVTTGEFVGPRSKNKPDKRCSTARRSCERPEQNSATWS